MQSETVPAVTRGRPRRRLTRAFWPVVRFTRRWLGVLEVFAWVVFFALAIGFLTLRYWVLPNIERYRGDIVTAVQHAIGQKVTIGSIEPDWRGMLPRFVLADVRVYDKDGREALVLPIVDNVVSWKTLLHGELRLHSLAIERPRLTLRRARDGAIYIAGIRLDDKPGEGNLADWVLDQREIEVRNAEIGWIDELRGAPPLMLTQLNFRLRSEDYEHSVGLSARPPAELGSALELRAELAGRSVKELKTWNGRMFAELGTTDLAGWRAWIDYPIDIRKGHGAVRVWATLVEGKVRRATADLALTDVNVRLAKDLPVLEVSTVRGRLQGRDNERGYEFGARDLALTSTRTPEMHATSFHVNWERAAGERPQRGLVNADLLELAPVARLAEYMPLPADLRRLLAELAPSGNLLDVRFDWSGELPEAKAFSLKSRFAGLAIQPWRTVPGFSGLSGRIDASERKGVLHLAAQKATLELPKVFPDPQIALDALNGEVQWERAAGALSVRIASASYANQDLAGTASGTYRHDGKGPGAIDLSAQLARASAKNLPKYLPLGTIMGEATRKWVASSILAGQSSDVRLRLKGDLKDFPFADPAKGQFQVVARVTGAALEYANGWPRIDAIEGDLVFERDKMDIVGRSGTILGAKVQNVKVSIPSLSARQTMLLINGHAEGPTAEFFKFIQQSPVRRMIDGVTDGMSASGSGKLQLRLDLPLEDLARTKVAGEYQFQGNTTVVDARLPPIERATGRVGFSESAFTVHEARGQLFGGPVLISGGTNPDGGGVTVTARGDATVAGMAAIFDHPWRARLAGASPYTATVAVKGARTQISFESSLRGVTSELPPPLAKSAAEALPLRVDIFPGENRDRISVSVAKIVTAEFLRVKQGNEMQTQRTAVSLTPAPGEPLRMPERPGTMVYGSLPALDLDRWRALFAGDGAAGGAAASVANLDMRLGTLDMQGKRLSDVALRAGIDSSGWSASLKAAELAGEITYRPEGQGRLIARLARLQIPPDAPGAAPASGAKDLPSIDLIADNFTHRGKRFGRVELVAQHDGPNWRIDRLAMTNPEASILGSGAWRTGSTSRIALKVHFESSDVGRFLERLGYPDRIQGGSAKIDGSLAWNGDPTTIDFASLSGDLQLSAEKGEFPKIETGLGRVLSLFSLNLHDATTKGFAFETISSSFQVSRGVLTTKDFRVHGSSADIGMSGDIDLQKETQDVRVKVVPSLRRGVTALATIVNPVVGVGAAIAQSILKEPVGQILSYEYSVSGSWDEPKVVQLGATPRAPSEAP